MTDTRTDRQTERPPAAPAPESPAGNVVPLVIIAGLFLWLGLAAGWSAVVIVIGIIVMVFFHELGHYMTAKWAGMKVTEFFIGFGPRIWSFRRGETDYGLKPILAGAYVKIIGMHNLDEVDPADEPRTYRQASYPRRLSVGLAGSAMHFLMALVLLFLIYAVVGVDDANNWTIAQVTNDSPAEELGLQPGDRLLSVAGEEVRDWEGVADIVGPRAGDRVTVRYERDGEARQGSVQLARENPDGKKIGFLGVGPDFATKRENPLVAAKEGVSDFGRVTWESGKALVSFFSPGSIGEYADKVGSAGEDPREPKSSDPEERISDEGNRFLSPIGAVRLGATFTEEGIRGLFFFFVMINIFVGIFNLVPLLPLDGGHVAIATYEAIRSRISGRRYYVDIAKLLPVTYAVVLVLVTIGITALYLDVVDPIELP